MSTTSTRHPLEGPAKVLVGSVRAVHRNRVTASFMGLLLMFVGGLGYLVFGALDQNPFADTYRVRVELAESGGLLAGQNVTLRGAVVGTVESVDVAGDRVVAVASIDSDTRIPADGKVRTAALSAAGEQYLDFRPDSENEPYLSDGALVTADRTSSPVPLSRLLGSLGDTLAQIDPEKVRAISQELGVSEAGPEKLADIIDGGLFLISTLDGVLPETTSLLRNSKVVLTTIGETSPGLQDTAADLSTTLTGVAEMSGGYTELVNRAPETLRAVDTLIEQNSPTMVQLLGNLTISSQMVNQRVPALNEFFFPTERPSSALDRLATVFHDGYAWALAGIYPRRDCDYDVPRQVGTVPNFPEIYLNADCTDPDPSLVVRGARNAPRPPGVSYPPPGADPLAKSSPTPTGPLTVPTPYGGIYADVPWPYYVPPR